MVLFGKDGVWPGRQGPTTPVMLFSCLLSRVGVVGCLTGMYVYYMVRHTKNPEAKWLDSCSNRTSLEVKKNTYSA